MNAKWRDEWDCWCSSTCCSTEQISMSFGPRAALRSVDLHLQRGEVLGLVGDNGAGKSTLVKILTGLSRPDGGRIYLEGEEVEVSFRAAPTPTRHRDCVPGSGAG